MPPPIITYEVYYWEKERWELVATYPSNRAREAVQEAQAAEKINNQAVKVIRETYNPENSSTSEAVVYLSKKIRIKNTVKEPSPSNWFFDSTALKEQHISSKEKSIRSSVKLTLIIIASLTLAGLAAVFALLVSISVSEHSLTASQSTIILFGVFILIFILSAVPLSIKTINWEDFNSSKNRNKSPANKTKTPKSSLNLLERILGKEKKQIKTYEKSTNTHEESKEDLENKKDIKAEEQNKEKEKDKEEEAEKEDVDKVSEAEAETEAKTDADKGEVEDIEEKEEPFKFRQELKETIITMAKFLSGIMSAIKIKYPQATSYRQFGINLVVAGAIEPLKQKENISDKDSIDILRETIKLIGIKNTVAKLFCDRLDEYFLEPHYLKMLRTGNEAMELLLSNNIAPFVKICDAFDEWHEDNSINEALQGIVTIMFTDIVGSTAHTQNVGDSVAQQIVRTHNHIVRSALKQYKGKEVKHTGDGIMASFNSPSSAVSASIKIMADIDKHNYETPHMPLYIRIGLNSGEPITEENDLFGTTVQLGARICNEAAQNQILVSNVVKELVAGSAQKFTCLGSVELKGIKEPQILFEVEMLEDAENEDENTAQTETSGEEENIEQSETTKENNEPHAEVAENKEET
ncbi:MAG: adenylate/guanylate cyclase domain-containing protein [Alphaproteobacteria bacterium]|nr:adenylate/guanylate cyclase domain-containing protein [Alphaproteobacteria bacterium]